MIMQNLKFIKVDILMTKKEIIIRVDETLKKEFKKTCAIHDDTMTDIITKSIKKYISEKNKKLVY